MRLTVAGLKGGPGKTTTAIFTAAGLAADGTPVLLIDADPLSQSATDWYMLTGEAWPDHVHVIPWGQRDLQRRVDSGDYPHVVFDTGGESDAILAAALMMSEQMIAPSGTSPAELRRIPATFTTAARVDQVRPITARVLLTKVRAGTRAATDARQLLETEGVPVMAAQVSLWQHYADAYGTWPGDVAEYGPVLDELREGVPA